MRNTFGFIAVISALILLSGCATTHQERATTQGAMVGAAAGAVIGAQNDKPVEGAIIGGVLGAMAGAVLAEGSEDRVIESEPRYHRRTTCRRGAEYFDRAANVRDLDRKVTLMRQGLRLCPNNPAAHNDLGVALMLRGNYGQAERHFGHALQLDPGYVPARRNLTRLNRNMKRDSREFKYDRREMRRDERHDSRRGYRDSYDKQRGDGYERKRDNDGRRDYRYGD